MCAAGYVGAVPVVERAPEEPPPFVVLVQGPPGVSPFDESSSVTVPVVWCPGGLSMVPVP